MNWKNTSKLNWIRIFEKTAESVITNKDIQENKKYEFKRQE